jgi:hypothetical protein
MQARGRPQYCANLAMKINTKLDGVNCILAPQNVPAFMKEPFIMFGALWF